MILADGETLTGQLVRIGPAERVRPEITATAAAGRRAGNGRERHLPVAARRRAQIQFGLGFRPARPWASSPTTSASR